MCIKLPGMGNNLRRLREARGWTHDEAAEAMGMSRGGFIKLERGERKLDEDRIRVAADVFQVTREVVMAEQTPIRVMGRIGAGGTIEPDYEQVPLDGLYTIDLPFAVPDGIIGLEVDGISMMPVYRPKDVILVWEEQKRPTGDFVGEEAAVRTARGLRALKEIQRGRSRSKFNLHSHNAPLIEDVDIVWVGEIYLIVRARQVASAHHAMARASQRRADRRSRATEGMDELPLTDKRRTAK